ncbi:MAG TPA: hypothetical protein VM368_00020 [Flavisolibacter sp.]|nr:hypothetical protein [Flavisolibacter sp.]
MKIFLLMHLLCLLTVTPPQEKKPPKKKKAAIEKTFQIIPSVIFTQEL